MSEHVVMVRLECRRRICRHVFEVPDTDYPEGCPKCGERHITYSDRQPRPRMWWSDTYGLLTEVPRKPENDGRHIKWHEPGIGHRLMKQLPPDAVTLIVQPPRWQAEQTARDEYSMIWTKGRGRVGDHEKALKHALGVVLYGDRPAPESGSLQQWAVSSPSVPLEPHNSREAVMFTLAQVPDGHIVTRVRENDTDPWPAWKDEDA